MTFKLWSKIYKVLGWINIGIAIADFILILGCLSVSIKAPFILYVGTIFAIIVAKLMFHFSNSAKELSELLKEDEDA